MTKGERKTLVAIVVIAVVFSLIFGFIMNRYNNYKAEHTLGMENFVEEPYTPSTPPTNTDIPVALDNIKAIPEYAHVNRKPAVENKPEVVPSMDGPVINIDEEGEIVGSNEIDLGNGMKMTISTVSDEEINSVNQEIAEKTESSASQNL